MIKVKATYLTIFLAIINLITGFGQNPLYLGIPKIYNYTKDIYNASSQNWAIAQDDRGFLYLANTEGVLIYDGINWEIVHLPGLYIARDVKIAPSGRIYVCGYNNFGYLSADSVGSFKYVSLINKKKSHSNLQNIWTLAVNKNYVAFYNDSGLYIYNDKNNQINFIPVKPISNLTTIYDSTYLITNHTLYKIDFEKKKLVPSLANKLVAKNKQSISYAAAVFGNKILLKSGETLILTDKNFNILKTRPDPDYFYNDINALTSNSKYIYVNFSRQGLFVLDTNLNIIYHLTKESGLLVNSVYNLFLDSYQNLWVASDFGLNYIIFNTGYSYLDKSVNFSRNVYSVPFQNNLVLGQANSIRYIPYKELFDPLKAFKKANLIKGSYGQTWSYLLLDTNLFIGANPDIYKINKNLKITYLPVNYTNVWKITRFSPVIALMATDEGLYMAKIKDNNLTNIHKIKSIPATFRNVIVTKNKQVWLFGYTDRLALLRATLDTLNDTLKIITTYDQKRGVNLNQYVWLSYDPVADQIIIDNDNILKKYDPKTDKFIPYTEINKHFKGKSVYLIGVDSLGNLWINVVDYKQIPGLKYRIYLFKRENGKLIFNRYSSNTLVYRDYADGVTTLNNRYVILSSTKGPVIFDYFFPFNIKQHAPKVYIRRITLSANDSVLWDGNTLSGKKLTSTPPKNLKIKYKNNGLVFYVAAPFFENPELLQFSYYLKGFDKKWSAWTTDHKKVYSFLKEGSYTFMVKVRNIYELESQTFQFSFKILPPWYRTNWAYAIYAVLLIGLLYFTIHLYTYSLRKKNERLEQIIKERTKEIEMKNIELEQQKEEIQAQAEELSEINKELEKLSLIVQKTDNAVLLTDEKGNFIWVNPAFTKIFGYTLEELITQISPNIISKNTPDRIKKLIQKCISERKTVEYETSFKTKSGDKIWVHTTLTPIVNEENEITGLIAIDSDITQIKEAEEKIRLQNENIKGSIYYAQVIQQSILPLEDEIKAYFDTFVLYIPRDIVSGDFYWLSKKFKNNQNPYPNNCPVQNKNLDINEYIFFAVVDCTGHGVPGAFMSLIGNRALENIINQKFIHDPKRILEQMDKTLIETFKHTEENYRDGMVVSICKFEKICIDNQPVIKVTFSGAKLDILHYIAKRHTALEYKGVRRAIGQNLNKNLQFKNYTFYAHLNDIIYMYTDGYKDQNNIQRNRIGIHKFKQLLIQNSERPMSEIKMALEDFLYSWMKGSEQRDDITVVGLKIDRL